METSLPVNVYRLKAYPAGTATTKPRSVVPTLTISEFRIHVQNASLPNMLEKCSVVYGPPNVPPKAFPGDSAMSRIQTSGRSVSTTKCPSTT